MSVKIFLVDDHQIVRDGLRLVIREEPDMMVVGEASNGQMALAMVEELQPDIILMDIELDDISGIEVSRQIHTRFPQIKIIILSGYPDPDFASQAIEIGVCGYLLKTDASEEVVRAIRSVIAGKVYFCPEMVTSVFLDYKKLLESRPSEKPLLSEREREVLKLIAEGHRTKEIADKLNISLKTFDTYRARLTTKLGINTTAELTRYAIREGLISL